MRGPALGLLTPRNLLPHGLTDTFRNVCTHPPTCTHIFTSPASHTHIHTHTHKTHTAQKHTSLHVKFSWVFILERWKILFISNTENNNVLLSSYTLTWIHIVWLEFRAQRKASYLIYRKYIPHILLESPRVFHSSSHCMPEWKLISQQTRWNSNCKWHRNHVWLLNSKCKMHVT